MARSSVPAFLKLSADRLLLNGVAYDQEAIAAELERLQTSGKVNAIIMSVDESANAQRLVDMLLVLRKLPDINVQIVR